MKVNWKIIPDWLTTVTAEVIDDGHGLTLNHPMAWDGTEHLQPKIWISGTSKPSWDDETEHLLFAYLPDCAVEFEVGDTTETCIQFRPPEQTVMTNLTTEEARSYAWSQVKDGVGTNGWTAGDHFTYSGFFNMGWDDRAQLEKQLAQPEQEPVATVIKKGAYRQWMSVALGQLPDGKGTSMTPQQIDAMKLALEALDGLYLPGELERVNKAITALREALAEQPAQRTWVGLTTDELKEVADRYHLKPPNIPVALRTIEAKLKEKNT